MSTFLIFYCLVYDILLVMGFCFENIQLRVYYTWNLVCFYVIHKMVSLVENQQLHLLVYWSTSYRTLKIPVALLQQGI